MKNKYFKALLIGMLITPTAHKIATSQRGYLAFGGEILIIPLLMLILLAIDQAKEVIRTFKEL